MTTAGKPSAAAALLHFIQTLIEAGRQHLADLRSNLTPEDTQNTGIAFGTFNLAVIFARIQRGLRIAAALHDRVAATAGRIDAPARIHAPATPRKSYPRRAPKPSDQDDNAALLARLPTDREIAAMIRYRPIGSVILDICADLGINLQHPLWPEVKRVLYRHGAQERALHERTFRRIESAWREAKSGPAQGWRFYGRIPETTGPPHTVAA